MANTIVLITGANRGVGKALLTAYLTRPDITAIATVRKVTPEETANLDSIPRGPNSNLITVPLSLDDASSITDAVAQLQTKHNIQHIDIAIANAGICTQWGRVENLSDADALTHFDINALGLLRLFRVFAPLLHAASQPKLVYVSTESSIIGRLQGSPALNSAYGLSKAAGNFLIEKINAENERLVAFPISPGWVQTGMGQRGAKIAGLENAPVTVEESMKGVLGEIDNASKESTSNRFLSYNGETLPW